MAPAVPPAAPCVHARFSCYYHASQTTGNRFFPRPLWMLLLWPCRGSCAADATHGKNVGRLLSHPLHLCWILPVFFEATRSWATGFPHNASCPRKTMTNSLLKWLSPHDSLLSSFRDALWCFTLAEIEIQTALTRSETTIPRDHEKPVTSTAVYARFFAFIIRRRSMLLLPYFVWNWDTDFHNNTNHSLTRPWETDNFHIFLCRNLCDLHFETLYGAFALPWLKLRYRPWQ